MIVVDCSYTLAMVMPDAQRPRSLPLAEQAPLVAPAVWVLEIANALRTAVRHGRLAAEQAETLSRRLDDYGLSVDRTEVTVHQRYIAAQTHGLTGYDAAYLDLALQRRYALATLDTRMAALARKLGLVVHD